MAMSKEDAIALKRDIVAPFIGRAFGYLTVKALIEGTGRTKVICNCVCGSEKDYLLGSLK